MSISRKSTETSISYRIAIIGPASVGKSSITLRYVNNLFSIHYSPTLEDEYKRNVMIDGIPAEVNILDTAGEEDFRALITQYVTSNEAFILAYSIDKKDTFTSLEFYLQNVKSCNKDAPIVLVGNKCDLENKRQITADEGKELALRYGARFFESSAQNNINIEPIFTYLVRELRTMRRQKIEIDRKIKIDEQKKKEEEENKGFFGGAT